MKMHIPAHIPAEMRKVYEENYKLITHNTGRLMLLAGDQKVEHLNDDFYGEDIAKEDNDPEHIFKIASRANIGVFATQLGLISKYGPDYKDVPYLVKLNSKTHLVKTEQSDPMSSAWFGIEQVVELRENSGLKIAGIGYTIYLGSEYETQMLAEAAQLIFDAQYAGLVTVLWIYPRGEAVPDEKNPHLIAGAAGVAACLGSDFVKVNAPKQEGKNSAELLQEAVGAAGRTQVVCAGGSSTDAEKFLHSLHEQIHVGGTSGNATGRNIHQRPLEEAIRFTNAIYAITVENKSVDEAVKIYNEGSSKKHEFTEGKSDID
jgi:fructose-bisphosphate aldolase/6-deoxy-5-ketofructose 1-phosphate synthase